MSTPGGRQWSTPDFSDANPPTPPKQGDKGPNYYVDEHTFESGSVPGNTGAIESDWSGLVDSDGLDGMSMDAGNVANGWGGENIRGYRPSPVGGTYNPGQGGKPGSPGTEYSNAAYRGEPWMTTKTLSMRSRGLP